MIHSAKFGSIERFIGVLVEHYAGAFPPWLAPVQVQAHPDRRAPQRLPRRRGAADAAPGLRVEIDDSDDRMQKKIRNAQLQKVPFMVIAGDHDMEAGAVSFRYRDGDQDNGVPVDEADRPRDRGRRQARAGVNESLHQTHGVRGLDRLWTPHRMAYVVAATRRRHRGLPVLRDPRAARR